MQSVGTNRVFEIDNFHPFPEKLRELALQQQFIDWMGPDGEVYKRVAILEIPGIRDMIEGLFGPVDMHGMAFRLNYNEEEPNAAIHSDLGWGTHALVHYLCEGEGGTAFWRHKESGSVRIDTGDNWLFEKVVRDWNDELKWSMREMHHVKFNRALIYESALFHSRYPFKAFGDSPETGRLIVVAFFTPENKI
jgi:hypothetical protein